MRIYDRLIQERLDQAGKRYEWFLYARRCCGLAALAGFVALLLGAAAVCGWVTDRGDLVGSLVCLAIGLVAMLVLLALVAIVSRPRETKLVRLMEEANPTLLDRLNTLLSLSRERQSPRVDSFRKRIERQASAVVAREDLSLPRPSLWWSLLALAVFAVAFSWFYHRFAPLGRLSAAAEVEEETLEIPEAPPLEPEKKPMWREARIVRPGRDLATTKGASIPLRIEISSSEPVANAAWHTTVNGDREERNALPPVSDSRYASYEPTIDLAEQDVVEWDVLTYYAEATPKQGSRFVSQVYFVDVRPPLEELEELPGERRGAPYGLLSQLTGLVENQERVLGAVHHRYHRPSGDAARDEREREALAQAEDELARATDHLAASMDDGSGEETLAEAKAELSRAGSSLGGMADALRDREGLPRYVEGWEALAELAATRRLLHEAAVTSPGIFDGVDERRTRGDDRSSTEIARRAAEAREADAETVRAARELAREQRDIVERTRTGQAECRTVFTTALRNSRPTNEIDEISIAAKRVYIHTSWRFITDMSHDYLCLGYDGAGRQVVYNRTSFTPRSQVANTWSSHEFKKRTDRPGNWKFEIYVDGRKVVEKRLTVLDEEERPPSKPRATAKAPPYRPVDPSSSYQELARKEDALREKLAELQRRNPDLTQAASEEMRKAKKSLEDAADRMRRDEREARQRTSSG